MYNDLEQKALNWLFRELQKHRMEQGAREAQSAPVNELREKGEQIEIIDLCIDRVLNHTKKPTCRGDVS